MSLRRILLVTLFQVIATLLLLIAFAAYMATTITSPLFAMRPLFAWVTSCIFALGVFLHWLIAKTTKIYAGWAYWLIFVVSLFVLFSPGGLVGVVTIFVLLTSSTFQQMRNGTATPPEKLPCPECHQVRGDRKIRKMRCSKVLSGGWTCPTCGCDVARMAISGLAEGEARTSGAGDERDRRVETRQRAHRNGQARPAGLPE